MKIIQDLSLSIKQVNIVLYKRSVTIQCALFGFNKEIIFRVDDLSVKIIIYNHFVGSITAFDSFDPSLKIIQVRVDCF